MATVNKDFKVKHGLIVEGTSGTINNQTILTEVDGDAYILDLIGGETLITSVDANDFTVTAGELTIANGSDLARTGDITTAIDNIDTDVIEEGATNKYFSTTLVDNHISGGDGIDYSSGTISADLGTGLQIDISGQIEINRSTVDGWYEASGAVSTHSDLTTGVHGVAGDVVGTSDTQTLTNKTIGESIDINDSLDMIVGSINSNLSNINIFASNDLNLNSLAGDIVLNPGGGAYVGSVSAGNTIATNGYVDNAVSGLSWKQAVNLKSNSNVNVSGDFVGVVIDGHGALDINDDGYRLLLTGQSTDSENGIWELSVSGSTLVASRPADSDTYEELIGAAVYVMEGDQYGATSWVQGNHYLADFTSQDWTQFSGQGSVTAGTGITVDGLEVSVDRTTVDTWYEAAGAVSNHSDLTTGVHGVTGDVVGTSDSQNLTNKTIDAASNTLSNIANSSLTNSSITVNGYSTDLGSSVTLDTNDVSENIGATNLYFTDDRAKTSAAELLTGISTTLNNITITGDGTGLVITAENGVADSDTDDLTEGTTNLYFTDQRAIDALQDTTPNFTAIEIDSIAKQIAATTGLVATASTVTAYQFPISEYRSAKFLVKTAYGTHTELSEVLLTLDTSNNIAITEYAIVGTNGSSMAITADVDGTNVRLRVTTLNNNSTVNVVGTLLA